MVLFCIRGNESVGCVKCGEFLVCLRNCSLFKKDSALWSLMGETGSLWRPVANFVISCTESSGPNTRELSVG